MMYREEEQALRVALVAPQMLCWGLQQLIGSQPGFCLAAVAGDLDAARRELASAPSTVMVADMDDPGQLALLATFLSDHPHIRVLALTGARDTAALEALVVHGLRGMLRKNDAPATLLRAIERVAAGELWIDRGATGRIFMEMMRQKEARQDDPELARIATLTQRERQAIVALLADASAPGKVIATRMHISENTLRNHLSSIYCKLELSNRLDLYAFATRHRLDKSAAM